MVKLQVTKQVKRIGDKENNINDLANRGIVLYRYVTAICYHVMAIYRYLPFSIILYQYRNNQGRKSIRRLRLYSLFTVGWKALQFIYGLLESRMVYYIVYLQSVRRLYSLSIVYQKAIQFIYGLLEGLTVYLRPVRRPHSLFYGP